MRVKKAREKPANVVSVTVWSLPSGKRTVPVMYGVRRHASVVFPKDFWLARVKFGTLVRYYTVLGRPTKEIARSLYACLGHEAHCKAARRVMTPVEAYMFSAASSRVAWLCLLSPHYHRERTWCDMAGAWHAPVRVRFAKSRGAA